MKEICGDITITHRLTAVEKATYLLSNLVRGLLGYLPPMRMRFWRGTAHENQPNSPGRTYLNAYLRTELPRQLPLDAPIRVLDIGCGTGYVRKLLVELGYHGEYTGLDVTREPGFDSHEVPEFVTRFIEAPIGDLTEENAYDLVISNTALEHIPDDREAAEKAYQALAPHGIAVHIVPSFWSLFLYLFHGYRQYTPRRVRNVFKGQSYSVERLGGLASFLLHFFGITVPERIAGRPPVRKRKSYVSLAAWARRIDRFLPLCSSTYVVTVRKRPARVLFALPSLLMGGGIEHQLLQQLARYDRTRFSLSIAVLFSYGERASFADKLPADVPFVELRFTRGTDLAAWRRLWGLLRRCDPDVVVTSMFSANTALRVLKPFFRYRVITREHNTYDEKTVVQRAVDHLLSYVSCRIVAVSEGVADYTSKQARIPRSKFTVIPNGVDSDAMQDWQRAHDREALRAELGIGKSGRLVLTVGRLKATKNHAALIRAFVAFSKERPEYRLVIIGDGIEKERLERLIASVGTGKITLLQRYGRETWPYYAAADLFILPSLREGFPNVMLEAMAFGLPLIATRVAGSVECVIEGVNGLFAGYTDAGLKAALRSMANREHDFGSFGHASRERSKAFNITTIVTRYEETFLSCA